MIYRCIVSRRNRHGILEEWKIEFHFLPIIPSFHNSKLPISGSGSQLYQRTSDERLDYILDNFEVGHAGWQTGREGRRSDFKGDGRVAHAKGERPEGERGDPHGNSSKQ